MRLVTSMVLAGPRSMQALASGKENAGISGLLGMVSRFNEENVPEAQKVGVENGIALGLAVGTGRSQPLLHSSY